MSLPAIHWIEANDGVIRGNTDPLVRVIDASSTSGIELIDGGAQSRGTPGIRLCNPA
jgi:hypothetical protein